MTGAVFIRPAALPRFCRLLTVGVTSHVTGCLARIDATGPVVITATTPPPHLLCSACAADLRARAVTADLGPWVGVLGVAAEIEVDPDEEDADEGGAFEDLLDEPGGGM